MDNYVYFVEALSGDLVCSQCREPISYEKDYLHADAKIGQFNVDIFRHKGCIYLEEEFRVLALRVR